MIGEGASIGPFVAVGENVVIGRNAVLHPHVVDLRRRAHRRRLLRPLARRGARVLPDRRPGHPRRTASWSAETASVSRYRADGTHYKIVQSGVTVIEDDVEIQTLTSVDRATVGETRVKRGAKIDSLVQVGHACVVGEDNIICAQIGLAGSSILGRNVVLAGQVGVSGTPDHTRQCRGLRAERRRRRRGRRRASSPALPPSTPPEWRRAVTAFPKLPELVQDRARIEEARRGTGSSRPLAGRNP